MKKFSLLLLLALSVNVIYAQQKTIYLVRHAKSSRDNPDLKDIERPLAERGFKDAPKVAKRLNKKGIKPDLLYSSPSVRTQQTARYFCNELEYDYSKIQWDSSIYRCSPTALTTAIMGLDNKYDQVMIFGHNPSMTRCANYFQSDTIFEKVVTTGVVAIQFNIKKWEEVKKKKGKFLFYEYPKRK